MKCASFCSVLFHFHLGAVSVEASFAAVEVKR